MKNKNKKNISEATSDSSGGRGSYVLPMQPGFRLFKKSQLEPFTVEVSEFDNAELYADSLDGNMDESENEIRKMEAVAKKISRFKKNHPVQNDEDGDNINPFPGQIKEDLAVWFGTKKKPKGSKQPKGPWVNICRKDKNGKHPPCGRPEATDKAYPKCRAAGVAGKMSDSEKRSACQQKRRAEKSNPKSGTGNKPKLVSYKPRNENKIKITESQFERLVLLLKEQNNKPQYYFDNIGLKKVGNDYYAFKNDKFKTDLGILSKESELGYVVDNGRLVFNDKTVFANLLSKKDNPQNTNKVIYLGDDNIPYIADISFGTMNSQIAEELIKKGTYSTPTGKEIKVKQFLVKNGKYYTPLLKNTERANKA